MCSRETYRSAPEDASTLATPEVTHFLPVVPGTQAFMDDDGVTDVSVSDRYGEHLLWYRAREKRGAGLDAVPPALRGTGILNPLQLASAAFFEHPPWYQRVIEEDILAGRRGIAGWNGQTTDVGLFIPYWEPPSRRVAEAQGMEWGSGWTWLKIGGTILLVAGAIALTVATFGWGALLVPAIVAGGGALLWGGGALVHHYTAEGSGWHDVGRVMSAVGKGAVAAGVTMAAAPGAAFLGGAYPILGLAMAGYGLYSVGTEIHDIATTNWAGKDWIDVVDRVAPLAGSVIGGFAARAAIRQGFRAGQDWRAERWLQRLEAETKGAHFYKRHGAQTTLAQQKQRSITGETPDGYQGKPVDSSRFVRHYHQMKAIKAALKAYARTGSETYRKSLEEVIGEGYLKGGVGPRTTTKVLVRVPGGRPITAFPAVNP